MVHRNSERDGKMVGRSQIEDLQYDGIWAFLGRNCTAIKHFYPKGKKNCSLLTRQNKVML